MKMWTMPRNGETNKNYVHLTKANSQRTYYSLSLNFLVTYTELKKEDYDLNTVLFTWPQRIVPVFNEGDNIVTRSRLSNQDELKSRKEKLTTEMDGYAKQLEEYHSFGDSNEIGRYLKASQKLSSRLENVAERIQTLNREEGMLGWESTKFPVLTETISSLAPYLSLYQTSVDFQRYYHAWMSGPFLKLDPEVVEGEVTNMWKNMYKLIGVLENDMAAMEIAQMTKEQIEKFKVHLPLVSIVCNPGMRDRHWKEISQVVGFRFQPDENTSLSAVLDRNLGEYMDKLDQISAVATKEYSFEKALAKMYGEWQAVEFVTSEYRGTGTHILAALDDIQSLLDDHIVKTQTMRGSPFIKAFEEETQIWETKLITMQVNEKVEI